MKKFGGAGMKCTKCDKICAYTIQEQPEEKQMESPEDKMLTGDNMQTK